MSYKKENRKSAKMIKLMQVLLSESLYWDKC